MIVRLGLDPTDFTTEEGRLAESLRRMEGSAQRGARNIQESVGAGTVQFFRMLESPISSLRRHFEDLAQTIDQPQQRLRQLEDQGRRTGEGVEGGALAGARGLRVLGAAGLGVFAAYELLSKSIASASSGAARLFGAGIGAASAGTSFNEFSAISQALYRVGNVPREQTEATLRGLGSAQAGYGQAGPGGDAARAQLVTLNTGLAALGITGVDVWRDRPEQIMEKISAALARVPDGQFNPDNIAAQLGMPSEEVYGLRRAARRPGGLPGAISAEREKAATDDQRDAASDLIDASNNLSIAWERLARDMNALIDGPLGKLLNALAWFAEGEIPSAGNTQYKKETGDTSEQGFFPSWQRFKWNVRNSPVGRALGLGTGDAAPGRALGLGTGDAASGHIDGVATPNDQVLGTVLGTARSGGLSTAATQGLVAAGLGEGGFSGAWSPGDGGSSHGPWQLHSGGELDRYTREGNAPGDVSAQTRYVMKRMDELHPGWRTSNDAAQVARWMNDFERSTDWVTRGVDNYQKHLSQAGGMVSPGGGTKNFVAPTSVPDYFSNEGPGGYSSAIQTSQAAQGSTSVTHNAGDVNLHGDIVVHAPLREGNAIADAVQERVRRVSLATSSNTGLE